MRATVLLLVVLLFSIGAPVRADEPLSASVNRLEQMTDACQRNLGLSSEECGCIFSKSFETDLSNVDLSFYYGKANERLSPKAFETLERLRASCTGNPAGTETAAGSGASEHTALCRSKSNMDGPRCTCFLKKTASGGYASNDIEMFLRGRASKMSEFSLYTEMTILLLDCESEIVRSN